MKQQYFSSRQLAVTLSILFFTSMASAQQYDIYVYDIKKGAAVKVTNVPNANMYNAAWSNNGKKIAADVTGSPAAPYSQSIFITDVQTGTSTPLIGAEAGNDAAWSPDGEKVAFDAWEDYYHINWWTQNIYTVPANGGTRSLVRFNAHHASWNPEGNKVAFDDNYGYIATKDIITGNETFVTWYGDRPSWSPNGQYIAFDGASWAGGGVWVIKVDPSGYPIGFAKQITTSGYGPTWKNNSKEIVFIDWPNGDPDLYSVQVTGGTPTRVCGRVGGFDKGDYDPAYSNNGQFIAWSSFTDGTSSIQVNKQKYSVGDESLAKGNFALEQNYPNPFRDDTKISFRVAAPTHVVLNIYNMAGQKIETLVNADYSAGYYTIAWKGKDKNGHTLPRGAYLYQLQTNRGIQSRSMSLLR